MLMTLAACKPQQPNTDSSPPTTQETATPSKPLPPAFASATECLSVCQSKWSDQDMSNEALKYQPPIPSKLLEFLENPVEQERFLKLMGRLPPDLRPAGAPQLENREFRYPVSGTENGKLLSIVGGRLTNVTETRGRLLYFYSDSFGFDPKNRLLHLIVLVDPITRDTAVWLAIHGNEERRYVLGSDDLHGPLLAYAVATEIEAADARARREQKIADALPSEVLFPLRRHKDEVTARLQALSDWFDAEGQAINPPPLDKSWYVVGSDQKSCTKSSLSPAQKIDQIKAAGTNPDIYERASSGTLDSVEVSTRGGGNESKWIFYRTRVICEALLPIAVPTPEKYK